MRIPRDRSLDSTLFLLLDGYDFILKRCRRYGTDIFQTRLLFRKTICLMGEDAARIFYDTDRFRRKGAAPKRLQKTLFGRPGIQALDGEPHRQRKEAFMSLMTPEQIGHLADRTAAEWTEAIKTWEHRDEIVLFDEVRDILTRAVCAWSGIPLPESEVRRRADEFEGMIDGAGGIGPRYGRGLRARKKGEKWIMSMVRQVRAGELHPPAGSALDVFARYRGPRGKLLKPQEAAVEIINVLRPTVAVSRFIVFIALALHEHPLWRRKVREGGEEEAEMFVQEVRRFYPFFPFAAARVRRRFEWKGYRFPRGRRVLLDLYGTDHDPRTWEDPDRFRPERFRQWNGSPFNFIP